MSFDIVLYPDQHADATHTLAVLRSRGHWPSDRNATNQFDEIAPSHCRPRGLRTGQTSILEGGLDGDLTAQLSGFGN